MKEDIKTKIQSMLKNYKDHKIDHMIVDHKKKVYIDSGKKAAAEIKFHQELEQAKK